jgi:type VI secretion system secreted protein VgrG
MPSPQSGTAGAIVPPVVPENAFDADTADPGAVEEAKKSERATGTGKYGSQKIASTTDENEAADEKKTSWIEIELVDTEGNPVPGMKYEITLPDNKVKNGSLGADGTAKVTGIDPGNCKITFPDLDKDAWEPG